MKQYIWISFALSFLVACKTDTSSHGHDHGEHTHAAHGEEVHSTMSLTIFNDNTELFVEFPHLVLNHVSEFAAHLTNLETYKPYTEGSVKVSLIVGGKGYSKTVNKPVREGIFVPGIMPKKSGSATLIFEVDSKYGKEKFVAKNIPVFKNHEEAKSFTSTENDDNAISFLKEQAWKIDFATSSVNLTTFQNVIKTTGTLLPAVNMEKQVVATANGVVHFSSTDIVAGKTIQKNANLFRVSGSELTGSNLSILHTRAKLNLEKAKTEFDRASSLRKDQIISEKDYLAAKTAFESAKSDFNNINKNFNANGISIKSPVKGFICNVYINEGQYVEKGTVLAKVDQGSRLMLKADIYQKHLTELAHIKSANFKLPYRNQIFNIDSLNGKLLAYGKDIHEQDYTTPLYFELDLTPDLYSGSFVEVFLKSKKANKALVIPKSAILEDQGLKYVFVQIGGENYEKRFITIGSDNGFEVEIMGGLHENERVVSKGTYFVKLASLAGVLPAHSHEH